MEDQKNKTTATSSAAEQTLEEQRSYAGYFSGSDLTFDPMKDLNLPANYDEVVARFEKLQGDRAVEVMN
jgi:hypothetical protein